MTSVSDEITLMAEETSNSTSTPYVPPTKKPRMEEEGTGAFKPVGALTFLIDNFREFSKRPPGKTSMRHCDVKVSVRGFTFGLAIYPHWRVSKRDPTGRREHMGVIVKCENASGCDARGDGSWSCLACVRFRVKTTLQSQRDGLYEFTHRFFAGAVKSSLESDVPLRFDRLFDPKYGFYNEKEDTLELIMEISVDSPVGIMQLPKPDTIQVNGEAVAVNKNQLAMHSPYFHSMFYNAQFDEGKSGEYKVAVEAPATVYHFKRMLETMYPENKPLDDQCIEGVLHLANQFLMTDVEGKCLEFLTEKSTKSALFKYRVADKYGCIALKKHVLHKLKVTDFKDKMFKTNVAEFVQLGSDAAAAFMTRYDKLFPPESDEEDE